MVRQLYDRLWVGGGGSKGHLTRAWMSGQPGCTPRTHPSLHARAVGDWVQVTWSCWYPRTDIWTWDKTNFVVCRKTVVTTWTVVVVEVLMLWVSCSCEHRQVITAVWQEATARLSCGVEPQWPVWWGWVVSFVGTQTAHTERFCETTSTRFRVNRLCHRLKEKRTRVRRVQMSNRSSMNQQFANIPSSTWSLIVLRRPTGVNSLPNLCELCWCLACVPSILLSITRRRWVDRCRNLPVPCLVKHVT